MYMGPTKAFVVFLDYDIISTNEETRFHPVFFWAIPSGFAQLKLYSFEQIDSLQAIQKKKTIVFIHTDWCQFCQAMKNTTFKDKAIIEDLNTNFYFVDFNAEEKQTILFNQHSFTFKSNGNNSGTHELAIALGTMNNQITYPVVCILNSENDIIFQYNNYLTITDFRLVLTQFKE